MNQPKTKMKRPDALQGAVENKFKVEDKNRSDYKKKSSPTCLHKSFPTLNDFIETSNRELRNDARHIFVQHSMALYYKVVPMRLLS